MTEERRCEACGLAIPPNFGPGRPRKYCTACIPPGTGAEAIKAWRACNPGHDAAYNAARRRKVSAW